MNCLFCNDKEKNYRPQAGDDFICSSCVQLLVGTDQADLKRAHSKAIEKGYLNKARVIESFLEDKEKDEQRKPTAKSVKRSPDRKRALRNVRTQERTIRQIEDRQTTTLL